MRLCPGGAGVPGIGHVSGVVFDPSGAAVPQARVVLLTASDTEVRWTMTDAAGRFRIEGLDTATYVLAVQKAGFGECRRSVVSKTRRTSVWKSHSASGPSTSPSP